MFGNNPKRPPIKGDGHELFIQDIFKTLQAEGPHAGIPAIFIRLGGCNLACSFCDTEFENFSAKSTDEIINNTQHLSLNSKGQQTIFLVVITGGEPMRQPIGLLCNKLILLGYKIQIETNGTLYQELPQEVEIVCSPKTTDDKYYPINKQLQSRITAFKFIISNNKSGYNKVPILDYIRSNSNMLKEDNASARYNTSVFIQAMDEYDEKLNKENKQLAVAIALQNGYRLSYQIHKDLDIK